MTKRYAGEIIRPHASTLTAQVLAWVNETRAQLDLPPLDSLKRGSMSTSSCPVAQSIQRGSTDACSAGYYRVFVIRADDGPLAFSVPYYVTTWMQAFDNGLLPEYLS